MRKNNLSTVLSVIPLFLLLFLAANIYADAPVEYSLMTFEDEFDGSNLDLYTWTHQDGILPTVSDGEMHIAIQKQENVYRGAQIYTESFTQRFGYFESRFRITDDQGMCNAFWLNTPESVITNDKDRFEIDIQEAFNRYRSDGNCKLKMSIFDGGVPDSGPQEYSEYISADLSTDFHTYALEWATDNSVRWYLDGNPIPLFEVPSTIMNAYKSLLPLKVRYSAYWAQWEVAAGYLPESEFTQMDVDYVRVYQKPGWSGYTDDDWNTESNWGPDGIPGVGVTAVFNQPAANATINLNEDVEVQALYFQLADCPSMTIAGGSNLILGAIPDGNGIGGITLDSSVVHDQFINANIIAQRTIGLYNFTDPDDGATLHINGNISAASDIGLRLMNTGPICMNGIISLSGMGNIRKYGSGTATFAAPNDYNIVTWIHEGAIRITDDQGLGTNLSGTFICSSGCLELAGNITCNEAFRLQGHQEDAISTHIINTTGTNVLENTIKLDDVGEGTHFNISCDAGTLSITGQITNYNQDPPGTSYSLHLTGESDGEIQGDINNFENYQIHIIKEGSGTWTLSGNNQYDGLTEVREGNLLINDNTSTEEVIVNSTGHLLVDGGTITSATWAVQGTVSTPVASSSQYNIATGILDIDGGSMEVGLGNSVDLTGTLVTIRNGGLLEVPFTGDSDTQVTIQDAGSHWSVSEPLHIGSASAGSGHIGSVTIDPGARLTSTESIEVSGTDSLTLNDGEISASLHIGNSAQVSLSGSIDGSVTVDTSSTITASGDLTMGNTGSTNGFFSEGTMNVGEHTVFLQDADQARAGHIIIDGGTLQAPNIFLLGSDDTLYGWGMVQSGILAEADTTITATGPLTLGNASSRAGFESLGTLEVQESQTVTLLDEDRALLGSNTSVRENGTLIAENGVSLGADESLFGTSGSTVDAPIYGIDGSSILALTDYDKTLSLGNINRYDGFNFAGSLRIGYLFPDPYVSIPSNVLILDADSAKLHGSVALIAGSTLSSINGIVLNGHLWTGISNGTIDGDFTNLGLVDGPAVSGKSLRFLDDVDGDGSYSGNIAFAARFNPGNSTAMVEFDNLQLEETAELHIEIGGTIRGDKYDALDVSGTLLLDGCLSVSLIDGFEPSLGNTFDILDWGTLVPGSEFYTLDLCALPGLAWDTSNLYTTGILAVIEPNPIPGDANRDGTVDVSDLGILATNYGTTSGAEWGDADFNSDGAVDVSDLGVLASHYGETTSEASVPEPGIITLLLCGLVSLINCRHWK